MTILRPRLAKIETIPTRGESFGTRRRFEDGDQTVGPQTFNVVKSCFSINPQIVPIRSENEMKLNIHQKCKKYIKKSENQHYPKKATNKIRNESDQRFQRLLNCRH